MAKIPIKGVKAWWHDGHIDIEMPYDKIEFELKPGDEFRCFLKKDKKLGIKIRPFVEFFIREKKQKDKV